MEQDEDLLNIVLGALRYAAFGCSAAPIVHLDFLQHSMTQRTAPLHCARPAEDPAPHAPPPTDVAAKHKEATAAASAAQRATQAQRGADTQQQQQQQQQGSRPGSGSAANGLQRQVSGMQVRVLVMGEMLHCGCAVV